MIERTRQIGQNYKSVTPVIVVNNKNFDIAIPKKLPAVIFNNPLEGYDAIT
jgi:hypothetical protein